MNPANFYAANIQVTPDRAREIEQHSKKSIDKSRRSTNQNAVLETEKRRRISDTNAKSIFTREKPNFDDFARSLLNSTEVRMGSIGSYCNKYKPEGKRFYAATRGVTVEDCGLYIDQDHPFLCATPYGIVRPNEGKPYLVQVTTPYRTRFNRSIADACREDPKEFPLEMLAGNFQLKKNHDIYFRIQVQLQCTKLERCELAVYLAGLPLPEEVATDNVVNLEPEAPAVVAPNPQTNQPSMEVVSVYRDTDFMEQQVLHRLEQFYLTYMLPILANPQPLPPPPPAAAADEPEEQDQ